ncbi:MFS transporter, DHA1 family, inner membrane transport protein [Pseudoxanthomonas sp. GM95]|nr:MFS transporter [Pseudoxanthomonas sp. GM95]SEM54284.1 MFS transporter, DHA1 family, inner membrane transport protein [Pseudoxanthomonas sp. GM95]
MRSGRLAAPASKGRYAAIIGALATGGFVIGLSEFAIMGLMPNVAHDFHVSEQAVGHLISAYALGVVVGAPLLAILGGRLRRKTLLMGLMALYALANLLSALAPTYHWMMAFRFISGLPHGAFFGVAALVAASVSRADRRGAAVARVMMGITLALVIGNPLAVALGQALSWRYAFVVVAIGALATAACLAIALPQTKDENNTNPLDELRDFNSAPVWLSLFTGALGFAGMFCVFSYMATTMLQVTHVSERWIPFAIGAFGVGSLLGAQFGGWMTDRLKQRAIPFSLLGAIAVLVIYTLAAKSSLLIIPAIVLVGTMGTLVPIMQIHLMDVSRGAQALASASNQAAFNVANALGPWAGGVAVSAGLGWESTGVVGAALAAIALLAWCLSPRAFKGHVA